MRNITCAPTCRTVEYVDGLNNVICQLCGKIICQLDIVYSGEIGGNREIECCCDCIDDFAGDNDIEITSDMLEPEVFAKFWDYAQTCVAEQKQPDEATRTLLAEALDGYVEYKNGKWFISIHREDGRIITVSDERICEYESEQKLAEDIAWQVINLK